MTKRTRVPAPDHRPVRPDTRAVAAWLDSHGLTGPNAPALAKRISEEIGHGREQAKETT